jgi:hypothetical protein
VEGETETDKKFTQKARDEAMKELELEIDFIFSDIMLISSLQNTHKRVRHISSL